MILRNTCIACCFVLGLGCERRERTAANRSGPPSAMTSAKAAPVEAAPRPVEPTRLTEMPGSAYQVSLAIDEDAAYLLTSHAAFRLVPGQPAQGIELPLGFGAVLTRSAFVFWSEGRIWRAPKQGGETRPVARFPHRPQYFVASGERFAWIDMSDAGVYTIQTLEGQKPRVLVSSSGELSDLDMIGDAIYFVQRPTEQSWRIGVVRVTGAAPEYGPEKQGRRPSMLTGSDAVYFYDVDKSEIRKLMGLSEESVQLSNFVCSPIHVATRIYCGCVEGLFDVSKESHQPRILSHGRPGPITNIVANEKMVVWTVDIGSEKLAVDMLPVR